MRSNRQNLRQTMPVLALALMAMVLAPLAAARAADDEGLFAISDPISEWTSALLGEESGREIWTGADVADHTWLVFSGFTYAPLGGIFESGPRVRVMSGYGAYSYDRSKATYAVKKSYADLLVGYQQRIEALTAKVFAGISFISHDVSPQDDITPVQGSEVGVKAMIELWLNLGETAWTSLDAAWAQPFETSSVRSRTGYRLKPHISIGVEAALNLDEGAICRLPSSTAGTCAITADEKTVQAMVTSGRGGLFARYDWTTGEASLSAGALGSDDWDQAIKPYATLQWLTQF